MPAQAGKLLCSRIGCYRFSRGIQIKTADLFGGQVLQQSLRLARAFDPGLLPLGEVQRRGQTQFSGSDWKAVSGITTDELRWTLIKTKAEG